MGSIWNACGSIVRACRRRGGFLVAGGVVIVIFFVPLQFWMALIGAILIALGIFLWIAA